MSKRDFALELLSAANDASIAINTIHKLLKEIQDIKFQKEMEALKNERKNISK